MLKYDCYLQRSRKLLHTSTELAELFADSGDAHARLGAVLEENGEAGLVQNRNFELDGLGILAAWRFPDHDERGLLGANL